ncbi:MAG TPA: zf-HC2 domain-containing protein, partial [Polyangiaceae bacterium]
MTRPDEHPKEWLDSAVAGELSPARRRELDLHLAGCPACSAQLAAASRTARPSRPSDSERRRDRVAVERALARTAHRRVRPSRRSRALLVRLAASVVVLASAASASVWAAHKWDLHWLGRDPLPPVSIGEWVAPAPVPAAEPRPSDDAEKSTVPPAEPMAEPSPAPKPAAVARRRVAEKPSAAELLQQARDLRRGGNLAGATGVYRNLERLYPQSQEAR